MKEILLTQGKVAIVDDIDYDFLMQCKWLYDSAGYPRQSGGGRRFMSRVLLERMGIKPKKYLQLKGNLDYRRDILCPPHSCLDKVGEIPLTQGQVALVDAVDYGYLMHWKWCHHNAGYAIRADWQNGRAFLVLMHRVVLERMGFTDFTEPDHVNGKKCDNRRCNLRPATRSQNCANRPRQSNNTSGYKGVSFMTRAGRYRAYINKDGKQYHLGLFDDLKEAARAYNKAAKKYFGEFAKLNEVD